MTPNPSSESGMDDADYLADCFDGHVPDWVCSVCGSADVVKEMGERRCLDCDNVWRIGFIPHEDTHADRQQREH